MIMKMLLTLVINQDKIHYFCGLRLINNLRNENTKNFNDNYCAGSIDFMQ